MRGEAPHRYFLTGKGVERNEPVSIIPVTEEDYYKRNAGFLRNIRKEGIEL
ncbi:MAG: hypothetical protein WCP16_22820 [Pseudanabaena sp. ELA645]